MSSKYRFDGQVAIVTGSGAGLGRAYAHLLAAHGAKVVINDVGGARDGVRPADQVVNEIRANGGVAVANYDSVTDGAKVVATAIDAFGRIDIVVNNAGILRDRAFHKMTRGEWDAVKSVHLDGTFAVTHAAWPHMRNQKYGRIVNITSVNGLYGQAGQANYASVKAGMVGFTKALAKEGARSNIKVNVVAPGAGSSMTATVLPEEIVKQWKPEYVAPTIAFLAHENVPCTGCVFESGGGWVAQVKYIRTDGHFFDLNKEITIDSVAEHWNNITDFTKSCDPEKDDITMRFLSLVSWAAVTHAITPLEIKGTRFFEYGTGRPFQAKGLDYYPRPNSGILDVNNHDFFTDAHEEIWSAHVKEFIELGVNSVRLYAVDPSQSHDKFMCALAGAGIYVLVDLASSCENCAITKDAYPACYPPQLKTRGQQIIVAFSKYNNVLGFSAGNEVNHVVKDMTVNAPCQKKFIRDMRAFIDSCASNMRYIPVGVVLADHERSKNALYYSCRTDPTDTLENAEWYGLNAYLQCDPMASMSPTTPGPGYRVLLNDFTAYKLPIPSLLTEFGCLNVGFPTVDGYQAQRTWLDAGWLLSSAFADVFAGGFAFEFSTENANSKGDAPYPFTSYGGQNYGVGYFQPETCDHKSTPCKFKRFPNFDSLATQYNGSTTLAGLPLRSAYTPTVVDSPACPSDVAALKDSTWASDGVTDMLCPDLTQTPLCPGDIINTGKGKVLPPSPKTVSPVPNVPTVTPKPTTGGNSADYTSAAPSIQQSALIVGTILAYLTL